jgi:hypothetical protein
MDLQEAVDSIDVHFSTYGGHLARSWEVVHAVCAEALKPSHNRQIMPCPMCEQVVCVCSRMGTA